MDVDIVEQVEDWESEPFSGGYAGLQDLSDRSFTGAVETGGTYLFMLNGRVVGVFDLPPAGSPTAPIETFEGADGTVYEAPHPSLPLLFTMLVSDGETRGQYYTEDTPIEEVDSQLSEGGFTGYVELSENVLSGDYYVVYQAGRSMSVAFVGASGRLHTEEEAFERASDEVGIYDVVAVDIDVIDIPEPAADAGAESASATGLDADAGAGSVAAGAGSGAGAGTALGDDADEDAPGDVDADEPVTETTSDPEAAASDRSDESAGASEAPDAASAETEDAAESAATDSVSGPETEPGADTTVGEADATEPRARGDTDVDTDTASGERSETASTDDRDTGQASERSDDELTDATERAPTSEAEAGPGSESVTRESADSAAPGSRGTNGSEEPEEPDETTEAATAADTGTETGDGTGDRTPSSSSEADLAVKAIPSLDPERSGGGAGEPRMAGIDARDRRGRTRPREREPDTSGAEPQPEPETAATDAVEAAEGPRTSSDMDTSEELESLQSELAEREERIEELEAELASATDEREELRAERDRLREERDDLEATVQELRERVRELEAETAGGATADELTRPEALEGTDLFVRYRSKSDPTLAAVTDGAARDDVVANLRLERHTRFDAADATVAGQPYDEFVETTLAHRFVRWVIEDLPYEIRDTGHTASLRDLYDVLPDIDRAELRGTVSVETETGPDERSFDIVLRDRMGDPLVVADLDTSRQPTGGEPMRSLIEDATVVAEGTENLAAAFFVTSSFFESDALEAARNETGTGLLSRDKRASVVKLSRKRGYHLCLVEARDESFHLTVPEL